MRQLASAEQQHLDHPVGRTQNALISGSRFPAFCFQQFKNL
jgi:hypothetical protein